MKAFGKMERDGQIRVGRKCLKANILGRCGNTLGVGKVEHLVAVAGGGIQPPGIFKEDGLSLKGQSEMAGANSGVAGKLRRVTILQGHVLGVLKGMASESVHVIVTSPPYW
jgi:hypothetical protein